MFLMCLLNVKILLNNNLRKNIYKQHLKPKDYGKHKVKGCRGITG